MLFVLRCVPRRRLRAHTPNKRPGNYVIEPTALHFAVRRCLIQSVRAEIDRYQLALGPRPANHRDYVDVYDFHFKTPELETENTAQHDRVREKQHKS